MKIVMKVEINLSSCVSKIVNQMTKMTAKKLKNITKIKERKSTKSKNVCQKILFMKLVCDGIRHRFQNNIILLLE